MRMSLAGDEAMLLGSGALYLPSHSTLLVADAHFGKAVSFRRLGVPVPEATTGATLGALDASIAQTGAARVVFLGDFLHSARARAPATLDAVQAWRDRHREVAMTLVRGNHDQRAGDPPPSFRIDVVDEPLAVGPFALRHHPLAVSHAYVLAGHWHPCVHLRGRAFQRLRLPCFWFGDEAGARPVGVLPAFGSFTGMHPIDGARGDRVYAVADGQVRALP